MCRSSKLTLPCDDMRKLRLVIIALTLFSLVFLIYQYFGIGSSFFSTRPSEAQIINLENDESSNNATYEEIFIKPYAYIISNKDLCSRGSAVENRNLSFLILITSAPHNFFERQTIRETWGSVAYRSNNTERVRVGFLLGATLNSTLQEKIFKESVSHSDIIQEDFHDTYRNLTLKSVMLLRWVTSFCPNVPFVMKTDDDMYVNIENLVSSFENVTEKFGTIYGIPIRNAAPLRDASNKWFMPKTQFKEDVYPDYSSGNAYVMSRDSVPNLLNASYNLPFMVMEDVFITGVCARETGMKHVEMEGFAWWHRTPNGCSFKDVITGHAVIPSEMKTIWKELTNKTLFCETPK